MGVFNYNRVELINDADKVMSLVHVADIANMGVADENLLV